VEFLKDKMRIPDPEILQKLNAAQDRKAERLRAGADPTVAGWQCLLEEMLVKLENYLVPGRVVTFQSVAPEERTVFEELSSILDLPPQVCAVFIPPSVLRAMVFAPESGPAAVRLVRDAGILLASRCRDYTIILNALFAAPPYAAGIDVYEKGNLLAGYSYRTVAECSANLPQVIRTYLR
jgi:hypothetical protein